jgi:hypothetical protein
MVSESARATVLPYIVVEAEDEWREATDTWVPRWVIVDGRGEIVSPPVPRTSAFTWCAALMWWLTAPEYHPHQRPALRGH